MLPDEYKQVEYIESSGNQYIDTKFKPNQNTCMLIDCSLLKLGPSRIIGSGLSQSRPFTIGMDSSNNFIARMYNQNKSYTIAGDASRHVFELNKNKFYIDNELKHEFEYAPFNSNNNINICKYGEDNAYITAMIIYGSKIFDNDVIIRNFIPCYCAMTVTDINGKECSSGTTGLYDIIEGKFYTNANTVEGTGEFIAGPEV